MGHTFGQIAHVSAEIFDKYDDIVKRCLLADMLNESFETLFGNGFNDEMLEKALKLLEASKIRARQGRGTIAFDPLASGRLNGKSAIFEIFDYSPPEHLNKWFYGRAIADNRVYEGKFFIRPTSHQAACKVVGSLHEYD